MNTSIHDVIVLLLYPEGVRGFLFKPLLLFHLALLLGMFGGSHFRELANSFETGSAFSRESISRRLSLNAIALIWFHCGCKIFNSFNCSDVSKTRNKF